jgi:hypothetical protein
MNEAKTAKVECDETPETGCELQRLPMLGKRKDLWQRWGSWTFAQAV